MRSRTLFFCIVWAVLLGAHSVVHAGPYDITPGVPIRFWGSAYGSAISSPGAKVLVTGSDFLAVNGGGTTSLTLQGFNPSGTALWFDSDDGTVNMEPGKVYAMTVSGAFASGSVTKVALNGAAPLGYRLEIDGVSRQRALHDTSNSRVFMVRLLGSSEQAYMAAADSTQLMVGRIYWQVGLGSLLNGKAAGAISIVDPGLGSTWSALYTPASLYYESPSSEVTVIEIAGGILRQVIANQAIADIVSSAQDGSLTSTQYEIRFYHPNQIETGSGLTVRTFNGQPYLTYRVEQGATNTALKITSTTRNTTALNSWTAAVARTAVTTLARVDTGDPGWPTYTWTRSDWNTSGQTQIAEQVTTSTGTTNDRIDTLEVRPGGGGTNATYLARKYHLYSWGEEITSSTSGSSNGMETSFTYYDDDTQVGRHGFLKSKVAPGGAWEAYDYWDATSAVATKRIGTLRYRYRPFGSSPASVLTNQTKGEVTTYDFSDDPFGFATRPSLVETSVETGGTSVVTAKSTTTYVDEAGPISGTTVVAATRNDFYAGGANDKLVTVTKFFREDTGDLFFRNQVHSVLRPDNVKISYAYQRGTFDESTKAFTVLDSGLSSRIATITGIAGAGYTTYSGYNIDDLSLVAGKSTLEVAIRDKRALVRRTESYAWVSSAWVLVGSIDFDYDTMGHLIKRVGSNGSTFECDYNGDQKIWDKDENGIRIDYEYDVAGRLWKRKKTTVDGTGFTTTVTYAYDSAGRVLSETISGTGTAETVVNSRNYDDAGRMKDETAAGLSQITYGYDVANRKRSVGTVDGGLRTETYYLDGQLYQTEEKIDANTTTNAYYTYSVDATNGQRIARVDQGTTISDRYLKTWSDWLGRQIKTTTPGYAKTSQAAYVEENFYDDATVGKGRLFKTTRTGYAPTYYEYDSLGQLTRSGLDLASPAGLTNDSIDRIQESEQWVESYDGAYWLKSESRAYFPGSSTATLVAVNRVRLTGHTGGVVSETRQWDVENIATTAATSTSTVSINRTTKTVTTTTVAAGLANSGTAVSVNGLSTSLTTTDGLVYTSEYDKLERPWRQKNPRHTTSTGNLGYSVMAYKTGTSLVESTTDAAGNTVGRTEYDGLGRASWARNADNKYTRFAYNLRGQLIRQWGDGTYPVEYEYNAYGERVKMRTWRDTPVDFSSATAFLPANYTYPAATGDATTWDYDGASGLLFQKTDADGKFVEFDYNQRRQVATRKWARSLPSNASFKVATDYFYDSGTGELINVNYNDSNETIPTPDLTYVYDRLGRITSVTQKTTEGGIGSRIFAYDPTSPWRLKDETLPAFFGSRVLTQVYESATSANTGSPLGGYTLGTIKGRGKGVELGVSGNTDRDISQTWVFSNQPRFAALAVKLNEGTEQQFIYAYETSSTLLDGYTRGSFTVFREYETNRDLVTRLESQYGTGTDSTRTRYDYGYDTMGRRQTARQKGTAYEAYTTGQTYGAVYNVYKYNARSELESVALYAGNTPSISPPSTDELPGRRFEYRYDSIGNRKSAGATGSTSATSGVGDDDYMVNSRNQYEGRENNLVAITGTVGSAANAKVAVLGLASLTRKDLFWAGSVEPNNGSGPAMGQTTVYAARAGSGTGGKDLIRKEDRTWLVPQRYQVFRYDADGNMTEDGLWTYTYNAENQLVRMTTQLPTVIYNFKRYQLDFKYDYMGRRIEKQVTDLEATTNATVGRRFVYDGWNVLAELDASGSAIQWAYTWGLDVTGSPSAAGGVGALLQITRYASGVPSASYYPTHDASGNVTSLVKASDGSLAAVYEYDPSGVQIRSEVLDTAVENNPFRFSTKYHDVETGLVYHDTRYYSPSLGRFINRDTIGEQGGLNLYAYVSNRVPNTWDRLGMAEGEGWQYASGQDANGNWSSWIDWGGGVSIWDIEQAKLNAATNISFSTYAEGAMANALLNVDLAALKTFNDLGGKDKLSPQEMAQLRDAVGTIITGIEMGDNIIASAVRAVNAALDAAGVVVQLPEGFEGLADGLSAISIKSESGSESSSPIVIAGSSIVVNAPNSVDITSGGGPASATTTQTSFTRGQNGTRNLLFYTDGTLTRSQALEIAQKQTQYLFNIGKEVGVDVTATLVLKTNLGEKLATNGTIDTRNQSSNAAWATALAAGSRPGVDLVIVLTANQLLGRLGQGISGTTFIGYGTILNINARDFSASHELGHQLGYRSTNAADPYHSSEPSNLMFHSGGNGIPDQQYLDLLTPKK